jgi:hypothetical protein
MDFSEFGNLGMWAALALIVVGGAVCSAVGGVAVQWRKARQAEVEAGLKAQMIERGMSAEEIERVIQSGNRPTPES